MIAESPFFLDTNILVYSEDRGSGSKSERAKDLITRGISESRGRISAQVLGEYFVTVTRKLAVTLPFSETKRRIALYSLMPVTAIDGPLVSAAIIAMERYGLGYWDALIVAAASASGAKILYSEDFNTGQEYLGVRVENPFQGG
jgi:predicted nucleic acid-binding protein